MPPRFAIAPRDMLANKPSHGAPCNGCGLCCYTSTCAIGRTLFNQERGPCPALEQDGEKFVCGVIKNPEKYSSKDPDALRDAAHTILYSGLGCDARFNGEPINHSFHHFLDEIDRETEYARRRAMALWEIKC